MLGTVTWQRYTDKLWASLPANLFTFACALQSIAVQMQRVHAELKAQVWGPWGQHVSAPPPPPNTSNPTRLLQLWDYEASLSIQVRGYYHAPTADRFTVLYATMCILSETADCQPSSRCPDSAHLSDQLQNCSIPLYDCSGHLCCLHV